MPSRQTTNTWLSETERKVWFEPRDAIFPGNQAPVVRKAADGERELAVLNWGFVLLQKDKAPKRVTNIRDDKAQTKFWKPSFEQRRCLVPASSYCEPKGEKPATWHWFSINGDDTRPVFAFPGVWTRYRGPLKKDGDSVEQEVFAFMTTEPNALTASINHERMPVLLTDPADFETWALGFDGGGVQTGAQLCGRPDADCAVGVRTQRPSRRVSTVP